MVLIWKFYKYLFYYSYIQKVKMWKDWAPERWASIEMTMLFLANLLSIGFIFALLTGGKIIIKFFASVEGLIFFAAIMFAHDYLFVYTKLYKKSLKNLI